ncbi:hypothetical protein EMIHUDRAFT_238137 [Emiliania huxleyi CCMP1516]|uniref:Uncharacterized protein n=2 Tax=Emiliania huxleyi TaxID=2903 RepID=A0A0D3JN57_EMIH1|nr:hypothetical protein EMIHUDRAFT_238137 [Emiliania huxleyi CCMP1516]EOD24942.1 hypothetical protein EMIHUDRAFT_238137 [Emiliania huxleyi CCMP1516]|eukprot:XP_005777371.1 hypothetical protein EMIHUDRAFT_238137 [Emiliania huxleyi CCMP1516]
MVRPKRLNMLEKLKLEFVPAAGNKLVLKLSPAPPPLADKQACVCVHVALRFSQESSSRLLADTGLQAPNYV